jgi:hypothetical protein
MTLSSNCLGCGRALYLIKKNGVTVVGKVKELVDLIVLPTATNLGCRRECFSVWWCLKEVWVGAGGR